MKYIVVFDVFISNEVYYCDTLEEVKQTIDQVAMPEEIEKGKVRIFKIEKEINLKSLFSQIEKDEENE
jgi:hypothetical protein